MELINRGNVKKTGKQNIQDILALTPVQEGMLFYYLKNPAVNYYFGQLNLEIIGEIDTEVFAEAWNVVIETNEMLRAVFRWEKVEHPVQIILKEYRLQPQYHDLSGECPLTAENRLEEIKIKDRQTRFDLRDVPFRVTLVKIREGKYRILISNHHILYDGWSNAIILKEFFRAYDNLDKGRESVKPVKTRFKEFLTWNRNLQLEREKQEIFWRGYLKGFDAPKVLLVKKRDKKGNITGLDNVRITLAADTKEKLECFVNKYKLTLASLFYTAWGLLFQKYTNSGDVIFGTPVSGRSVKIRGVEDIVGLFINTLPLRIKTLQDEKILDCLLGTNNMLQKREEFEDSSLVEIRKYSEINANEELFDSIVAMENYPLDIPLPEDSKKFSLNSYSMFETTHYDLTVSISTVEAINIDFSYNPELFDRDGIEGLSHHFMYLMGKITEDPEIKVWDIEIISKEEKRQVLFDFNDTESDYPHDKTLPQLFAEQVERTPDRTALVGSKRLVISREGAGGLAPLHITYRALNETSDGLVHLLREKGVTPDTIVGLMMERSLEMIIGLLGILEAGGAYLPIEPEYPVNRIRYMLADSGARILLTTPNLSEHITYKNGIVYVMDEINALRGSAAVAPASSHLHLSPRVNAPATSSAYIIYTSGTTGKPKGVVVENRSVVNILAAMQKEYPFKESDTYLLKTSYIFDVSVMELFGWFWGGGKLAVLEKDHEKDPEKILDKIRQTGVTHINFVPAMFNMFVDHLTPRNTGKIFSLRYVFLAGEALLPESVNKFRRLNTDIQLENIYGPTEGTVYSSKYSLSNWDGRGSIPIGKPMQNIELYIFDKFHRLQPIGLGGELCIGGKGVARGYLNNPELTAEKFVELETGAFTRGDRCGRQKIYSTGDLAGWLPDGNIEFLGRIDFQTKVRGYRIELGEIENRLLTHEGIKEAVVIIRCDTIGDKYLCAYFVSDREMTARELRAFLSGDLPAYMVPSSFVPVEKIPVTPSGKIDRKALPEPGTGTAGKDYLPPRDRKEEKLAEIWAEVLGIEKDLIGIDANFFQLGGHSLKAGTLVSRIHKELNVKVPLGEIFNDLCTIRGISEYLEGAVKEGFGSIEMEEKKDYYSLSSAQKRLYVLHRMAPGTITYNMYRTLLIEGEIDIKRFRETFRRFLRRHESLRTSFILIEDEPVQKIYDEVEFEIEYREAAEKTEGTRGLIDSFVRPFDLSHAPLLRVGLVKAGKRTYILTVDMHHIISDEVSHGILVKDFMSLYGERELSGLRLQYKDFTQWQKRQAESPEIKKQEAYWLGELKGEIPVLNIPTDYPRPLTQTFAGSSLSFKIGFNRWAALKELAFQEKATIFMVLLAIFNVMLSKLSGQEELVIGTVAAGRRHAELERIIGMFVNTLAIKNRPIGIIPFRTFLKEVKKRTLEAFANQDYQFEKLVETLAVKRDSTRNPLFDVMFVLQNVDNQALDIPGLKLKTYNHERMNTISKFDWTLEVFEEKETLSFNIEYSTDLFKRATAERFIGYFQKAIASVTEDKTGEQTLSQIEIIPHEEKREMLSEFNNFSARYPQNKAIHQLFTDQVRRVPDRIAVTGTESGPKGRGDGVGTRFIACGSFKELNERSRQIAYLLRKNGVKSDSVVGIMLEQQSMELIYGMLGILKAGGAYMPIDPDYPGDRLNYMIGDSGTNILLTTRELDKKVTAKHKAIYPEEIESPQKGIPEGSIENVNHPGNLAYIIYTSGTTGQPKGVMIEHKNVVRLMINDKFRFDFSRDDVWTMFHSFCFDFSVWEMYGALLYGGKLLIIPKMIARDPKRYLEILKQNKVTVLNQTPAAFYNLAAQELEQPGTRLALRYVIFGGEALSPAKLKAWKEKYAGVTLVNMYGITETTVHVTYKEIGAVEIASNISRIGKPIPTLSTAIMDKYLKLVPKGVGGELCVGGDGVGRGYLNRVELTEEKFIENPDKSGEKLYKSGDLVRCLEDGDLEYLGRIDRQVKIRGHRIELGEIENQLLRYDGIKEALLVVRENRRGEKYLCAYLVPHSGNPAPAANPLRLSELKTHLDKRLPGYMVPAYFVTLEMLPLTPNGKIDIKSLPSPGGMGLNSDAEYAGPRDAIEKKLVEAWEQVLDRKPIGVNDNFFEVGGDSIKTIQIAARMNQAGYEFDMKDIFHNPTIRELASFVRKLEKVAHQSVITGTIPLTPIQYWFFESEYVDRHHFNQAVMLHREEGFEVEAVKAVFSRLLEHHDALRMTFKESNEMIVQENHGPDYPFSLQVFEFRNREDAMEALEAAANETQAGINLQKGPLMKLALFHLDDGDRLLIVIHHLVIDTVSWRILLEDTAALYRQYIKGESLRLPLKTDSFKRWARKLSAYADTPSFLLQKSYWRELEAEDVPGIPKDFYGESSGKDEARVSFCLGEEETRHLLSRANEAFGTTVNDILLTALGLSIRKTFGNAKVLIALEGHGRGEILENVNIARTVGWFTSLYPVILNISYENDLVRQIKEVKENLHQVPAKGIGYGILKYLTAAEHKEGITFRLTPEVCFNYLGQFDGDVGQGSFRIVKDSPGRNQSIRQQRKYELDISGMTTGNQLEMTVTYSNKQYKTQTVEALWNNYRWELCRIIAFCLTRKEREFSPSDFTYSGLSIGQVEELCRREPVEDIYILTPMQEGMLFHALYNPDSSAYFVQMSYPFHGELEVELVEKSLAELFKRHEILRTAFVHEGITAPIQIVLEKRQPDFYYQDIRQIIPGNSREKEAFVKKFKEKDRKRKFDLSKDVLLRLAVLQLAEKEYEFLWSFHHILMDGWCTSILNAEFFEIYSALSNNKAYRLPKATPYRAYIEWLAKQDKEKAKAYWKNLLAGYHDAVGIPRKKMPDTDTREYKREEFYFMLDREKTKGLEELAVEKRVTLSVILQTIWGIMLMKYNDRPDVVFGMVVSGRPMDIEGMESMVGLFINTIPLRLYVEKNTSFTQLLREVQTQALEGEPYHYYSLAEIQSESKLKQNLMDHFLTFLNYPVIEQIGSTATRDSGNRADFEISNVESFERSNYDLDVLVYFLNRLKIKLRYNTNIYDSYFMKELADHIEEVCDQVLENNNILIEDIKLSSHRSKVNLGISIDDGGDFDL